MKGGTPSAFALYRRSDREAETGLRRAIGDTARPQHRREDHHTARASAGEAGEGTQGGSLATPKAPGSGRGSRPRPSGARATPRGQGTAAPGENQGPPDPGQTLPHRVPAQGLAPPRPRPLLEERPAPAAPPRPSAADEDGTGRDRAATAPRPPHAGRRQGKGVEGPCRRSGADGRGEGLTRVRRILRSPTRGENKMAAKEGKRGAQRKEASRHVTAPTRPRIGGRRGVTFA